MCNDITFQLYPGRPKITNENNNGTDVMPGEDESGTTTFTRATRIKNLNSTFFNNWNYNTYGMGLFGFILLIVVILAIMGLGWQTFSAGVITGFDKAIDVGTPIIKELTQEARDHVNNPEQLTTT